MSGKSSLSNTFVWIILGLLIVGLAGFGATNLSGTIRTVATVGDQMISVDDYARELQREIRATEAQTGQSLTMAQIEALGVDKVVLARLVALASLDDEVDQIGLSIGDANLQQEILEIPVFQGIDGNFDREAYRFALNQQGINESEFEADLRAESARTLVQGAIMAGVQMPDTLANSVIDFVGARRSFTWATLDASALPEPLPAPTESELQEFYDSHGDDFTLPETKRLTYAILRPDMLVDEVEIDDTALQQLYKDRADQYILPERRLVERLVFADDASAKSAMAQLEVNGTTFEQLVKDRGLDLSDVDMGDVTATSLGDASEAIFGASISDVVGPLPSSLGPALFRVNGVLAARVTTFEEALPDLRDELASDRARRLIELQAQDIDDLLAGGATLEEVADETDLELGQVNWTADSSDGVAAYPEFRAAAAAVTEADYPAIAYLGDGGVFALRWDETLPVRPVPFDEARDLVAAAWELEETSTALNALAQATVAELDAGATFESTGWTPKVETGLTRTAFVEGTPADFMVQVFEMEIGETRVTSADGLVQIVQLDALLPPQETPDTERMRVAINNQLNQSLSQALFEAFVRDAQTRVRPQVDQRAVTAVNTSFQ